MKKRAYRMQKRAVLEEQTRLRITQSAVALHGTLGPSRASISAIARHAGVRRSTLYHHFPDELTLFTACSNHWLAANPFPVLARWAAIKDTQQRLRLGLQELYSYYRRAQGMLSKVLRDEETMAILKQMLNGYRQYLSQAREILMRERKVNQPALTRVRAALGHALSFHAWQSLAIEQGLKDEIIADLMCRLVTAASTRTRGSAKP